MTDLTAKARRAAEWWNRAKAKDLAYCSEGTGWIVIEDAKRWCAYDRISDNVFIAFCEDRGWQDKEQEADGVEWELGSEFARVSGITTAWVHRDNDTWYWEVNDDAKERTRDSGGCHTREEARRQAVEAARGMG